MKAPSEPLRIAIFSDSALPVLNGVSISIRALITELRDQGHSVHLFTSQYYDYRDVDANTHRFPAVETPWTRGYPLAFPPFYPMLLKFRQHHFDVVHTHTPFTLGFVGLRWAESHQIPIVSTYHTLYDRYAHYIPLPRRYVRYKIAKHTHYYYNRVAHVITPSEASGKWLRRHAVTTPITVVPTGTPPASILDRSSLRQSLGVAPDQRVMLYVGRLAKEKNLETLLHMAKIVFETDPTLRLWLVGDGPYREVCTELIRTLDIGDRVRLVGSVPRDDVDKYYAIADLFVFASISETQGLVVQEAMTYGLPAVAVTGGGAGAGIVSGVNGFLVKNDPKDFAVQVRRVLGDDILCAKLSAGARETAKKYSTSEMCKSVLNIYRSVIGSPTAEEESNLVKL